MKKLYFSFLLCIPVVHTSEPPPDNRENTRKKECIGIITQLLFSVTQESAHENVKTDLDLIKECEQQAEKYCTENLDAYAKHPDTPFKQENTFLLDVKKPLNPNALSKSNIHNLATMTTPTLDHNHYDLPAGTEICSEYIHDATIYNKNEPLVLWNHGDSSTIEIEDPQMIEKCNGLEDKMVTLSLHINFLSQLRTCDLLGTGLSSTDIQNEIAKAQLYQKKLMLLMFHCKHEGYEKYTRIRTEKE